MDCYVDSFDAGSLFPSGEVATYSHPLTLLELLRRYDTKTGGRDWTFSQLSEHLQVWPQEASICLLLTIQANETRDSVLDEEIRPVSILVEDVETLRHRGLPRRSELGAEIVDTVEFVILALLNGVGGVRW